MDYKVKNGNIILSEEHFDLDETLDCGQAFRWERQPNDGNFRSYMGYYKNRPLEIMQPEAGKKIFVLKNVTEQEFLTIWSDYFDFSTDYGELKRRFSEDETLSAACKFAGGIRLLRQDAEECLISFIISQNNNIPRIKGIIGRLCEMYRAFPDISEMKGVTAQDLAPLRAGFRAGYLEDCVSRVNNGEINLAAIKEMPLDAAAKELMQIKGVGPKVAACVLLFGFYRTEAYPVDVWIKRVNRQYYPDGMPECVKGYEGIAQQYLFHYIRHRGEWNDSGG